MVPYCVRSDLPLYGISAVALSAIPTDTQDAACVSASELMDSYFRARYSLPLTAWGNDVRRCAAILATYDLMVTRGYNPAAGADENVRMRYEDQLAWLLKVSRQEAQPDVTPTQDEAPAFNDPRVTTNPARGWSRGRTVGVV